MPLRLFVLAAALLLVSACAARQPDVTARACRPSGPAVASNCTESQNKKLAASVVETRILDVAKPYIGTRYRYGGTTPKGFDCSGFTRFMFGQFGVELPHGSRSQVVLGKPVKREELRPGDLVFFDIRRRGRVSHVGIYLGDSRMIHASTHLGVVVDSLNDPYYARHYYTARRFPQLTEEVLALLEQQAANEQN